MSKPRRLQKPYFLVRQLNAHLQEENLQIIEWCPNSFSLTTIKKAVEQQKLQSVE